MLKEKIMKEALLILILAISIGYSFAQTNVYHPFPDSNTIWIGTDKSFDGIDCYIYNDYNLYISGDTTIGIHTYHKLYRDGYMWSNCPPPGYYYYGQYYGAFRQDTINKKIYLYLGYYGIDTLAYDFNLNAGDTLPTTYLIWPNSNYVESIDSVIVDGEYRKMYWISSQFTTNYLMLIEGIGTDHGAFAIFGENWMEASSDLWCVYQGNELIWQYFPNGYGCDLISSVKEQIPKNSISVYPNPFKSSTLIKVDGNYTNLELVMYNSFGQKVRDANLLTNQTTRIFRNNLTSGLYYIQIIQDNKLIGTKKIMISD